MFGSRPRAVIPATVDVAGSIIPLVVARSARARRITLRADAARRAVRLTLPVRARLSEALDFLGTHQGWLAERVAAWPARLVLADGVRLPFDGGTLTINHAAAARRTERDGDVLRVGGGADALPGRVLRWLRAAALTDLTARTQALAAAHDLRVTGVRVGDARARWGSCTADGRIAYSWRLILAPPHIRQGVVAHEVAHLVHRDHGPAFWALVRDLGGDPATERAWLRREHAALQRIG